MSVALIANRPRALQRIAELIEHEDGNVALRAAMYVVDRAPSNEEKLPENYQEALRQLRERLECGTLRLINLDDARLTASVRALLLAEGDA